MLLRGHRATVFALPPYANVSAYALGASQDKMEDKPNYAGQEREALHFQIISIFCRAACLSWIMSLSNGARAATKSLKSAEPNSTRKRTRPKSDTKRPGPLRAGSCLKRSVDPALGLSSGAPGRRGRASIRRSIARRSSTSRGLRKPSPSTSKRSTSIMERRACGDRRSSRLLRRERAPLCFVRTPRRTFPRVSGTAPQGALDRRIIAAPGSAVPRTGVPPPHRPPPAGTTVFSRPPGLVETPVRPV